MSDQTLTVKFRGICTHFRGIVPGIPHRVVLPDASPMRGGRLKVGEKPIEDYTIYPHTAIVFPERGEPIEYREFIEDCKIRRGVRLEIVNTVGRLEYDEDAFGKVPALTAFVEHYRPSTEVVHGGRARCYFDLFSGRVTTYEVGEEIHVQAEIRTKGAPVLQITPLMIEPPYEPEEMSRITLDTNELIVASSGPSCGKTSPYDFLLNYLTAEGGLPHAVSKDFPVGEVSTAPVDFDPFADLSREQIIKFLYGEAHTAMCSDSRYP